MACQVILKRTYFEDNWLAIWKKSEIRSLLQAIDKYNKRFMINCHKVKNSKENIIGNILLFFILSLSYETKLNKIKKNIETLHKIL